MQQSRSATFAALAVIAVLAITARGDGAAHRAEWPTHGIDAHELVWDAMNEHGLIVANGGVPTQPETGRVKRHLERMDSSLVRLDARDGTLSGQWRLEDPRLSLRHMAWNAEARALGIALQAEHDDEQAKARAPVLARFDGHSLGPVSAPVPLAGYGGDIAALGNTFAVSCPRAQGVALYGAGGAWDRFLPLAEACALASASAVLWAGGHPAALTWAHDTWATRSAPDVRLDNHWIAL